MDGGALEHVAQIVLYLLTLPFYDVCPVYISHQESLHRRDKCWVPCEYPIPVVTSPHLRSLSGLLSLRWEVRYWEGRRVIVGEEIPMVTVLFFTF